MKRIYRIVAILSMAVAGARAQNEEAIRKTKLQVAEAEAAADQAKLQARQAELQKLTDTVLQAKVYSVGGAVMGSAVKNAPYSAVEVNETTQMLADGTRIHRENQTTVYRDSEGRVRRETPEQVTIWDPVANTSYSLNPKTLTARKLPLGAAFTMAVNGGQPGTFVYRLSGPATETEFGLRVPPPPPAPLPPLTAAYEQTVKETARAVAGGRGGRGGPAAGKTESLGKQSIEGVPSEGTRVTSTIEAGVIGNDRPLHIVSETWYSAELQTQVKSVRTDPRTGEEVFRLSNVSRVEPPSTLFQVPAEYQLIERK